MRLTDDAEFYIGLKKGPDGEITHKLSTSFVDLVDSGFKIADIKIGYYVSELRGYYAYYDEGIIRIEYGTIYDSKFCGVDEIYGTPSMAIDACIKKNELNYTSWLYTFAKNNRTILLIPTEDGGDNIETTLKLAVNEKIENLQTEIEENRENLESCAAYFTVKEYLNLMNLKMSVRDYINMINDETEGDWKIWK